MNKLDLLNYQQSTADQNQTIARASMQAHNGAVKIRATSAIALRLLLRDPKF